MTLSAATHAVARIERRSVFRVLLAGSVLVPLAGLIVLGRQEAAMVRAQFGRDARRGVVTLRSAIEGRVQRAWAAAARVSREGAGAVMERDVSVWWGQPPAPGVRTEPAWIGDAVRRAARSRDVTTAPAAGPDGEELLVLAAAAERLGVALLSAPVREVVREALGSGERDGIAVRVMDDGLARPVYGGARGSGGLAFEDTLRFADRVWTVRLEAGRSYLGGPTAGIPWGWVAACLAVWGLAAWFGRRTRQVPAGSDSLSMGTWNCDIGAGRITGTESLFRVFGLAPAETFPPVEEWLAMIHAEDRVRMSRRFAQALAGTAPYETQYRVVRPDGEVRWLLAKGALVRDGAGRPARLQGITIDITSLKEAEKEAESLLEENQDRMRRMFAEAAVGVILTDTEGRILEINDFACRAAGYSRSQLLNCKVHSLIHPEDLERHQARFRKLVTGRGGCVAELRFLRRDGGVIWSRVSASPTIEEGRCTGTVSICEDITARRMAEAQLEFQALNDGLTGLPNRRLFEDRAAQALAAARREGTVLAAISLDLDGFNLLNETLGHAAADGILVEASRRLRGCLRGSDTLARVDGDEFAIILPNIQESGDAERVARKLIESLSPPFRSGEQEVLLTASGGISLFPRHAADAPELLRHAQAALYAAKRDGRNRCSFFSPELGRALKERIEFEGQLRGAVSRGEIVVHYQPEYDLRTGGLAGFEALARWKHSELGLIPPARFIPLAEETGMIVPIGMSVLEQACGAAVSWQKQGWPPVQVAVNVSGIQFFHDDFVERVFDVLRRTGLPPRLLQLELTESVAMTGFAGPAAKMAELRARGITLAVDDFGTGYSSLSYLARLPFQSMKIDRSFVHNLHEIADSRAMIQSLVSLAHNLNLTVVVEGVESPQELAAVRALGCDMVQGYLVGPPSASTARHLEGDRRLLLPSEILTYS